MYLHVRREKASREKDIDSIELPPKAQHNRQLLNLKES
jgi:hypothetical protein